MFQYGVKSDPHKGTRYEAGLYACPCEYIQHTHDHTQQNCWLGLDSIKLWFSFEAVQH